MRKHEKPCTLDLSNKTDIIDFFKDLANFGNMLQWDAEEERAKFIKRLKEFGWGRQQILEMEEIAHRCTRYHTGLPSIQERGDFSEYMRNKDRYN